MDRSNRELVFCHECENEWYRDEHGIICPQCTSEFTEVIERDHDPREPDPEPAHPLDSHNPWADTTADPDDMDIDSLGWQRNGSSFGQSRRQPPGAFPEQAATNPHLNNPLFGDFASMVNTIAGGRGFAPGGMGPFPPLRQGGVLQGGQRQQGQMFTTGPRIEVFGSGPGGASFTWTSSSTGNMRGAGGNPMGFTDILGSLLGPLAGIAAGPQNGDPRSQGGQPVPGSFAALLQGLMNPANAQHGDAVFTNEAFDRVMSQLMEQHVSGTAPGPAPPEAIRALPRKGATNEMMGDTGTAECSICMDNVAKGDEVLILPCKHWFHPPCIEAWLNEHDTCPVCRAGITPKEVPQDTPRSPGQQPLHNHDPFELARHQSGSQENPYVLQESPTQARRQRRVSHSGLSETRRRSNGSNESNAAPSITDRVRNFFGGGGTSSDQGSGSASGRS